MKSIVSSLLLLFVGTTMALIGSDTTFDPLDPCYQICERYPPNMTSTWTYGMEHDGWWIAHQALRGELDDFQTILGSLHGLSTKQRSAMQKWWRGHLKHMLSHHHNEDKIAKKFASQRFRWPAFIETDHDDVLQRLDSINTLLDKIVHSTLSEDVATHLSELTIAWTDYHHAMSQHLDREEEICISLMRAYFNQNQVQRMQQRLAMRGPRVETGAIVYYLGEEHMKKSMRMQKTPKIVEAIGWMLILKPRYRFYMKTMVKHLEVLRNKPL
jgi:hypothetical protein